MTTPAFRTMASQAKDLYVKPLVESYLVNAKFPDVFSITFRKEGGARPPDGWFHPSSHPTLPERMLLWYMVDPERWELEILSYESRMAVTMGTAVHGFIQMCMIDANILLRPTGTCVNCGKEHGFKKGQCPEWGAIDPILKRRGHMDGRLNPAIWPGMFEFKTINPKASFGLEDLTLDWVIKRHWDYYCQVQDYLDQTGEQQAILLFAVLGFPWKLVEIQIPYDPFVAQEIKNKYGRVREAEQMWNQGDEAGALAVVDACCAPRSKDSKVCPARLSCPVARL